MAKQSGNSRFLLLAILAAWQVPSANGAWELQTDFRSAMGGAILDRSVQENYQSLSGTEQFRLADQNITSNGIPVAIQGIVGTVNFVLGTPERSSDALVWGANSTSMRASLNIARIYAATTIRREFNGGVITIRVEGFCDDVRLSIAPEAGARIITQVRAQLNEGSLALRAERAEVAWPENAWKVDRLECQGIEGFGNVVRAEALRVLAQPQREVQTGLHAAIQQRLNAWSTSATQVALAPRLVFSDRTDVLSQSVPAQLVQNGAQILLSGMLRVHLPNVGGQNEVSPYNFQSAQGPALKDAETQVPVSAVRGFLMAALFAKAYKAKFTAQDFGPFRELMENQTAKRYVFPDLDRFSKDAPFYFETVSLSAPQLRNLRPGTRPGTVQADASAPAVIVMMAPDAQAGKHVPYVQFNAVLRGTAQFSIGEGKLEASLTAATVGLEAGWNRNYVARNKPNTKIDTKIIGEQLAKALTANTHRLDLPYWAWTTGRRLIPVGLALEGESVRILWDIRSNPAPQTKAAAMAQNN